MPTPDEATTRMAERIVNEDTGEPLAAYVQRLRVDDGLSWRAVAARIAEVTDGDVDLSHAWFHRHYGPLTDGPPASAAA